MSQEYFPIGGSSSASQRAPPNSEDSENDQPTSWAAPQYMTVGYGEKSAAAEALIASLNHDSGYGGSISGDSALEQRDLTDLQVGMLEDRPTPALTPTATEGSSDGMNRLLR